MSFAETMALYREAMDLGPLVEEYNNRLTAWKREEQQRVLDLLVSSFSIDLKGEERVYACRLEANGQMQVAHPEEAAWLDRTNAYVDGIKSRNEAIIAAGWAEAFASSREQRGGYRIEIVDKPKLEEGESS